MGLEINIEDDFLELANQFEKELGVAEIMKATRAAMNRTLITMRQAAIDGITEKLKIKPSSLRNKHMRLMKARGGTVDGLEASIDFNTHAIPMLEFVKGNKSPIEQKGIPVKKRRKLRVEITPGKKFVMKKAFIQNKTTTQVFKGRRGEGFKKQGTRSVGFIVINRGVGEKLVTIGKERFSERLLHELKFRVSRIAAKTIK